MKQFYCQCGQAVFFDSDECLAFSRNPYKDTSINDLANRDDIPFTRQRLTDCIKAAAVDMELRKRGHHYEHVHFEHLGQLARLKKQEQRLKKAQEANDNKLTSDRSGAYNNISGFLDSEIVP